MICNSKYLYKVELITTNDILEFARIASKCPYDVTLVNGSTDSMQRASSA